MNAPPLSLYVHLPWCVRKCPYCDFNSHRAGDDPPKSRYLDALKTDISNESLRANGRELISIFLGGGTPSLFTPGEIGQILDMAKQHFRFADDIEITMEANPGTVECGDPAGYRAAGVNRLSIGAQSFDDHLLESLGRIHSSDDIRRAVSEAQAAGFESINVDVMYALPGQDVAGAVSDLEQAVLLDTPHLSWYHLTLEPNTVFWSRPPAGLPDAELANAIEDAGAALLEDAGYRQYEVSAWARDGRTCRHNLNYWQFGDYLGVGAGAHGKFTDSEGIRRSQRPAHPLAYMEAVESERLPAAPAPLPARELEFEFMLNALRLSAGFEERLFAERTGLTPAALETAAAPAVSKGLLKRDSGGRWRPTGLGRRFLDDLTASFLPE